MKKVVFSIGSLFFIFFLLLIVFLYPHSTRITLEKGLAAAGIKERQIIYSSQFLLESNSSNSLDKQLEELKNSLQLKVEEKKFYTNPFGESGRLECFLTNGSRLDLNLDNYRYLVQGKEKLGEKLRFELTSQNEGVDQEERKYLKRIASLARNGKKDLLIFTCLLGKINGKLNEEQKSSLKDKVFRSVLAGEKQQFSYGSMSTILGYTPFIRQSLFMEGNKVNLQLVIRYNEKTNLTTIMLGSPIIDIEY